ncbi:MAG: T9SS C-terminal target domain-containing protein [Flectobacillus sp.]|uniref:T9SS C-terminal target domain-containing protein n=1 Tax=Flectobacillus sp. TaxID=50419 RepID=UPI003B9A328A
MKNIHKLLYIAAIALATTSCGKLENDFQEPTPVASREMVVVRGSITSNTTWTADKKYLLNGFVYVEEGVTLTIQPGTIIKGDLPTKGTLIIKPGAKILAEGTEDKPIVFTSNQAIGQRKAGDWGGVIILGKAKVNKTPITIEGENVTTFGGTNDADNSGILKYVRIEFAGVAFETDKEINGLTLGGVGYGTKIDYVQVSHSGDDAYEWFGGAVNAKHLISYRTLDDDFDTDNGFSGNVQYAVALRDPLVADQCSCSDSNGFESDNDGSGSTALPQTSAKFANVSIYIANGTVDKKYRSAFRIRRNSALSIYNSVVNGAFPKAGLELEGTLSQDNFKNGKSDYRGVVITGATTPILNVETTMFNDANRKNAISWSLTDLGLQADFNLLGAPKFTPQKGSRILADGVVLPTGFDSASFRGAFDGSNDWTQKWTNFNPQTTEY